MYGASGSYKGMPREDFILRGWKGRVRANELQFSPVKMLRALLQSPH